MKILKAYGKINLTLEVLGKRADGYHELRSVMQSISQFDSLMVEKTAGGIEITCSDPTVPTDHRNTIYQVAEEFYRCTHLSSGLKVVLKKGLPHQAGLGAASTDAAEILRFLWEEYHRPISFGELLKIGEKIGADIPFCLLGGTALAEGKGERLTPLPALPPCKMVVFKPMAGASTPEIFKGYDSIYPVPPNPSSLKLMEYLHQGDLAEIARNMGNVLEYGLNLPEIQTAKKMLIAHGALGAVMTGSGTGVVGLFPPKADLGEILSAGRATGFMAFSALPILQNFSSYLD